VFESDVYGETHRSNAANSELQLPPLNPPARPKLSPHQEARVRSARAKESRAKVQVLKAARDDEVRVTVEKVGSAFRDLTARRVNLTMDWCLSRLGEIAEAAAVAGDLTVSRNVVGDLMKHVRETTEVPADDRELLIMAVAELGRDAVLEAAAKVGLSLSEDVNMVNYVRRPAPSVQQIMAEAQHVLAGPDLDLDPPAISTAGREKLLAVLGKE
jgi:hypothetical protein